MLIAVWHILKAMTPYRELTPIQRTGSDPEKVEQNLVKRVEEPGFAVTLEQPEAA